MPVAPRRVLRLSLPIRALVHRLGIDGPCKRSLHDVLRSRNLASSLVVLRRLIRVVYATIDDAWRIRGSGFDPPLLHSDFCVHYRAVERPVEGDGDRSPVARAAGKTQTLGYAGSTRSACLARTR